jgi:hypothetical protein
MRMQRGQATTLALPKSAKMVAGKVFVERFEVVGFFTRFRTWR